MKKVLIVDDDRLILEDICKLISWESNGFCAPFTAENGKQAIEWMEKESIDLVITDISMPGMSGVELIKKAKKQFPKTTFAVLSNYDDFIYVKEAMKSGAVEYLLKYEVEPETFKIFLKQIKTRMEEESRTEKKYLNIMQMHKEVKTDILSHFFRQIYWGYEEEELLYKQAERLELPVKGGGVWIPVIAEFSARVKLPGEEMVFHAAAAAEEQLPENSRVFGVAVGGSYVFFAMYITEMSFLLLTTLTAKAVKTLKEYFEYEDIPVFLYEGRICLQLTELSGQREKEAVLRHLRFYSEFSIAQNNVLEQKKGDLPKEEWEMVMEEAVAGGLFALQEKLTMFAARLREFCPKEVQLKKYLIEELLAYMKDTHIDNWKEKIEDTEECSSLLEVLYEILKDLNHANRILGKVSRKEIKQAVEFLYQHYGEDITLNMLAERSCMSRAYFCKVFKEETGMSYTDLLNRIRIEKASYLLLKTNMNTREVAESIGCNDYRYFCRLFKSLVGKTCSEYRKENMGKGLKGRE